MKKTLWWRTAAIGLALVVALAVSSPALGGPSLRKLVKKEVARQIAKATGPAGANGATNVVIRDSAPQKVTSGTSSQVFEFCVGSEKAVGGGAVWVEVTDHNMRLLESSPAGSTGTAPTGWEALASNDTGSDKHLIVRAVCASP
jgi:hypothetical protein